MKKAISGARIFDGESLLEGRALVFSSAGIEAIVSARHIPDECEIIPADGQILAPGLIDLQVNGGGGLLFNNAPDLDGLRTICARRLAIAWQTAPGSRMKWQSAGCLRASPE